MDDVECWPTLENGRRGTGLSFRRCHLSPSLATAAAQTNSPVIGLHLSLTDIFSFIYVLPLPKGGKTSITSHDGQAS